MEIPLNLINEISNYRQYVYANGSALDIQAQAIVLKTASDSPTPA